VALSGALVAFGAWSYGDARAIGARLADERSSPAREGTSGRTPLVPAAIVEPLELATRLELLARDAGVRAEAVDLPPPDGDGAGAIGFRGRGDPSAAARLLAALEHPRERLSLRRCRLEPVDRELGLTLELDVVRSPVR
jgi:hypothetical protein